jgi:hypothetical protein
MMLHTGRAHAQTMYMGRQASSVVVVNALRLKVSTAWYSFPMQLTRVTIVLSG